MDLITLVPMVVSALVPYLAKGAEKLIDKTVDEGFEQRGKIWELVKGAFAEDELTTLNLFAENPDDVEKQAELRGELKHVLKANPDVASQLEELVKQIPAASQIKQNTITQSGDSNIAVQDTANSSIHINK